MEIIKIAGKFTKASIECQKQILKEDRFSICS